MPLNTETIAVRELGHRLEIARLKAKRTYQDLEAQTGISRGVLNALCRGKLTHWPHFGTVAKVAQALHLSLDALWKGLCDE